MNKVNILVVDDRPEGLLAVQAVLTSPSYNIITATSGNEALKHLLNESFAVILMDVQMPIMNGFETASIIKTREKCKDIPIIFMSAINQDEQYVYQGYGVGAIDYLLKPFDPYILRSKVAIFVDIFRKNILIREQAFQLRESELKTHAQKMDALELENLRRYQYLADSIPQIVFRFSPNGSYEYFNKVWFEYTGLSINSSVGLSWKEVLHPDDLAIMTDLFDVDSNEDGMECECRILNRNGEFRWHLIRIQPERYLNPTEISSWLGTATDIEDRKKNEEMQKFLSDAGELLISTLDYHQTLESISKFAVPYLADWIAFDLKTDENKLETVSFYHRSPDEIEKASKFYDATFKNQDSVFNIEHVMETGELKAFYEGTEDFSSAIIVPLILKGITVGTMTLVFEKQNRKYEKHYLEISEELSKRVVLAIENSRLYKLSQEAIEVRNDFLSIASHELNTPITSLKLQLQMVRKSLLMNKDGVFPVERFSKSVEASVKQVDRLINLIQILLDVSRIQSGKFTFSFESLVAQDIVTEVVERHKEIIQNSDCSLKVRKNFSGSVIWDKTRIEQVLTNLLTNAIKYAPGKIELCLDEKDENVVLSVSDYGKGIPEANLKSIFERFERASSNESVSGLGLGLYIVKQIAEGHHGRVEVNSSDTGSVFKIYLPKDSSKFENLKEAQFH